MTAARHPWSGLQINTAPGKPLSLGKVIFKATGTEDDQDTFDAVGLGSANDNPLLLDANGRMPEAWANNTDEFRIRVTDADDNIIIPSIDNYFFLSAVSISAAQVIAALAANAASVVINGADMDGTAFADFIGALTLGAAGSIDASAGAITLGTVTGATTFSSAITVTSANLTTPVLLTSVSGSAILDEDDMSSDSANQLATQQSIKAFVEAQVAGTGLILDSTTPRTALFTAEVGKWYLINTTGGSFDITMPDSPTAGTSLFGLQDYAGTFNANPPALLQAASDENIFRADANGSISINNFTGSFVMTDATNGWMLRGF